MLYERLLPKSHESQGNRDKSLFLSIKAVYLCAYSCMLWQKKFLSKLKVLKASETSIDILSKQFVGKTWIWSNICEFKNEHVIIWQKMSSLQKFEEYTYFQCLSLTDNHFFILLNPLHFIQRKRSFFWNQVIHFSNLKPFGSDTWTEIIYYLTFKNLAFLNECQ